MCPPIAHAYNPQGGIDFIDFAGQGTLQCMDGQNLFFNTRIFEDGGGGQCDPTGGSTLKIATSLPYSSGVGAYIFPNPVSIVNGVLSATTQAAMGLYCGTAAGVEVSRYTLDIELDPDNPWPDCDTSADYILEMIAEVWKYTDYVTIYTSQYEWSTVTCQGSTEDGRHRTESMKSRLHEIADEITRNPLTEEQKRQRLLAVAREKGLLGFEEVITQGAKLGLDVNSTVDLSRQYLTKARPFPPNTRKNTTQGTRYGRLGDGKQLMLWYAHWDWQANFDDYVAFGPFKVAIAKQYINDQNVCGINTDLDWSPM